MVANVSSIVLLILFSGNNGCINTYISGTFSRQFVKEVS